MNVVVAWLAKKFVGLPVAVIYLIRLSLGRRDEIRRIGEFLATYL